MRSSKARSLTAAMPPSPSRLGLPYVPVASSTTSAWTIASRPSAPGTSRRKGRRARRASPIASCLSSPSRPTASTRVAQRMRPRSAGSAATGSSSSCGDLVAGRQRVAARRVGQRRAHPRRDVHVPGREGAHVAPAAHVAADRRGAASKTVKSSPRPAAASAASRPIGPAPRMAMRVTSAPRLISIAPRLTHDTQTNAEDRRIRRRVRQPVRAARAAGRRPRARLRRAVLPRRPRRLRRRVRRGLAAAARARRALHRRQLRRRDRPRRRRLRLRLRRPARQRLRPAHVRLHARAHGRAVRGLDGGAARRAARRARRRRRAHGPRLAAGDQRLPVGVARRRGARAARARERGAAAAVHAHGDRVDARRRRHADRQRRRDRAAGQRRAHGGLVRGDRPRRTAPCATSSSWRWPTTGARRRRRCARPGCPSRSSRRSRPAGGRRAWRSCRRASGRAARFTSTARRCPPTGSRSTGPGWADPPARRDDGRPVVSLFGTALFPARLWIYTNFHCNLACDYCVVASSPRARPRELTAERFRALVDEAVARGLRRALPHRRRAVRPSADRRARRVRRRPPDDGRADERDALHRPPPRRARAARRPGEPHAAVLDRRRPRRDARPLARRGLVGAGDGRAALRGAARPAAARGDDADARQRG